MGRKKIERTAQEIEALKIKQRERNRTYRERVKREDPEKWKRMMDRLAKNSRIYYHELKETDPNRFKKDNRLAARKYRKDHPDEWREYHKKYMKDYWKNNPIKFKAHTIRCTGERIAGMTRYTRSKKYPMNPQTQTFIKQMYERRGLGENIDHIVSIPHFLEFWGDYQPDNFMDIIYCPPNLDITSKAENSRRRNFLTDDHVSVAETIENLFPLDMIGFKRYIENKSLDRKYKTV